MSDQAKIAANLRAFAIAVNSHDRENPAPHPAAFGIGMSGFDMDRLGFDEGEELWSGITVHADQGQSANFRVLCGATHGTPEAQTTDAVSRTEVPA